MAGVECRLTTLLKVPETRPILRADDRNGPIFVPLLCLGRFSPVTFSENARNTGFSASYSARAELNGIAKEKLLLEWRVLKLKIF